MLRTSGGRPRPGRERTTRGGTGEPGEQGEPGPDADPEAVARSICLRLLAAAPRTRVQLRQALARRAVPEAVAERVLSRLGELELIDDAAYARSYVSARTGSRAVGRRSLVASLRERGVPAELAADAVADVDEDAAALAFARSRAGRLAGLPPVVAKRRLVGQLARRGYPGPVVSRVVREVLGGS